MKKELSLEEIEIIREEKAEHSRAKDAIPMKPAIYLE